MDRADHRPLRSRIRELHPQFSDRPLERESHLIVYFNDEPGPTHAEVLAVFERAIANCQRAPAEHPALAESLRFQDAETCRCVIG